MKRRLLIGLAISAIAAMLFSSTALAWQPPGQRGYEGQPGNQGGYNHAGQPGIPPGLKGYEGQPGNQGGH